MTIVSATVSYTDSYHLVRFGRIAPGNGNGDWRGNGFTSSSGESQWVQTLKTCGNCISVN